MPDREHPLVAQGMRIARCALWLDGSPTAPRLLLLAYASLVLSATSFANAQEPAKKYELTKVEAHFFPREKDIDVRFTDPLDTNQPKDLKTTNIQITALPSKRLLRPSGVSRLIGSTRALRIGLSSATRLPDTDTHVRLCFHELSFLDVAGNRHFASHICGEGIIIAKENVGPALDQLLNPRVRESVILALTFVSDQVRADYLKDGTLEIQPRDLLGRTFAQIGIGDGGMLLLQENLIQLMPEKKIGIERLPLNPNISVRDLIDYLQLLEASGPDPVLTSPNVNWLENGWQWTKEHIEVAFVVCLSLLALGILSTRVVLMLLQFEIQPIRSLAPMFYVTPFGRFKLYRRYRNQLQKHPDVLDHANKYVDLPYALGNAEQDRSTMRLAERIKQSINQHHVEVIADGGRGKSTLSHFIAVCAARGEIGVDGRRLEPVIVDGVAYNGDLLETITNALIRDRAYVNSTIVKSQLLGVCRLIKSQVSQNDLAHRFPRPISQFGAD